MFAEFLDLGERFGIDYFPGGIDVGAKRRVFVGEAAEAVGAGA